MSGLACRSYVTWYNELTGNWATWEPGEGVQPGTVGVFDRDHRFIKNTTLARRGIAHDTLTAERPGQSRLAYSDGDVHLDFKASGHSAAGFEALGKADAGLRFTANRESACVLHMRDLSEAWIDDVDPVQRQIKQRLIAGKWEVDSVVVLRRTEARQGFAAVSLGSGQSFEAKASGDAHIAGVADIGHAGFTLASGRGRGSFLFYDFGPGSTPVFSSTLRVRHDLWARLLPWQHDRGVLISPDGRVYRALPEGLGDHELETRRYDPARSSMAPGELSAIAAEDLFEEVAAVPGEIDAPQPSMGAILGRAVGRAVSFLLPVPPPRAALAAADAADGAPPVAEAVSPGGLARFALFDRGDGEYWLEVSLEVSSEDPVIVRLRYTTSEQQRSELLVPVGSGPHSSSVVALPGYDGGSWRAWVPVPAASVWSDSPDLVTASVRAALSSSAVREWERLASAVPEHGRKLITEAMEAAAQEGW